MNSGRPEPRGVHVGPFNGARQTFSTERHESTAMLMFCRVLMRTHLLFLNDCVITTTIMSFWLLLLVLSERLISCCSSERWQTSSNRVIFLQSLRRQQRLQTLQTFCSSSADTCSLVWGILLYQPTWGEGLGASKQ